MKHMQTMKIHILLPVIVLFAVFGNYSQLSSEDLKVIYKIRISEEVMDNPLVLAAWQMYAKCKQEWREKIFFQHFPDEKKYRFSYKEELDCRKRLAEYWIDVKKGNPKAKDKYLDELIKAYNSIYFPEYIYKYYRASSWEAKKDRFRMNEYKKWAKEHLGRHYPQTYAHLEEIELR